jgi:hypothetical protein
MSKVENRKNVVRSVDWIIEHAAELKQELLKLAREGKPKPKPGTTLGRALKLFTTPGK